MRPDLRLEDALLLTGCDIDTYRASGPGGQKRNKTDSAVRLRHRSSGLIVIAEESRSQAENRARALKRLRKAMALRLREPPVEGVPPTVAVCINKAGRLDVGQRDGRYLPAVAAVLDVLHEAKGSLSDAATRLGISTGNLSSFLTDDGEVFVEVNRLRIAFGLRPLHRN